MSDISSVLLQNWVLLCKDKTVLSQTFGLLIVFIFHLLSLTVQVLVDVCEIVTDCARLSMLHQSNKTLAYVDFDIDYIIDWLQSAINYNVVEKYSLTKWKEPVHQVNILSYCASHSGEDNMKFGSFYGTANALFQWRYFTVELFLLFFWFITT